MPDIQYFHRKGAKPYLLAAILSVSAMTQPLIANADNESRLEEVVVTARKVEESAQSVPISVSAVTRETLENGFIQDLSDLAGAAPNVVIDPTIGFSNAASISIRGVSFQDVEKSFDPAVGVVVDGVYLATSAQALLDNFEIERVEILRGPQGTLFGKNTTGGAVNVVRARPARELSGEVSLSAGNWDSLETRASISLPVIEDSLYLRLAGLKRESDGYLKNTADGDKFSGADLMMLRGALLLEPNDTWEVYLNYDYVADRGDTVGLRNATLPVQLFAQPALLGINPLFPGYPADNGPLDEIRSDIDNKADYTTRAWSLEINRTGDRFTLTSVTGYRDVDENVHSDFDGENTANFNSTRIQDHKQLTQEVRLTSHWSENYQLVAGLYYFSSEYDLAQQIDVLTDWVPCGVLPFPFTSLGCSQSGVAGQDTQSIAAFAQININLRDDLRLTLGGRYTREEKDFYITPIAWPAGVLGTTKAEKEWTEFTPRASLDFQAAGNLFFFASLATGFKSGGYNGRAQTVTSIGPYSPEKVKTFELGMKSDWYDNRLRFNVTGFFNDYEDMQVELLRTATGGTGQETVVANAASATTYGLELELQASPVRSLFLFVNVGLLEAEYDDFLADLGSGLADNSDLSLRRAPELVYSVGGSYEMPVSAAYTLRFDARYTWQDDLQTTTQNLDLGHRESVGQLGAAVSFSDNAGDWEFSLFGRNLTDENYIADGIAIGGLVSLQTISRPRQWGARFTLRL